MKRLYVSVMVLLGFGIMTGQAPPAGGGPLTRHYRDGETLAYHMTGANDDWHYTADASAVVKTRADGKYVEEFRWTAMTSDGKTLTLPPAMADFRQMLSLDSGWTPAGSDLSKVDRRFTGPVTDLMTFYVDMWLVNRIGMLRRPGDHFHVPNPQTASWADGTRVLTGSDHIDFDLTFESMDAAKQTAVVKVRHVPPAQPKLQFPAAWMKTPVADTPNNWMEVVKTTDGKYQAGAGKETFDVSITVSTADGRMLAVNMENPVVTASRECDDAALTRCGEAREHTIHRHIEMTLAR